MTYNFSYTFLIHILYHIHIFNIFLLSKFIIIYIFSYPSLSLFFYVFSVDNRYNTLDQLKTKSSERELCLETFITQVVDVILSQLGEGSELSIQFLCLQIIYSFRNWQNLEIFLVRFFSSFFQSLLPKKHRFFNSKRVQNPWPIVACSILPCLLCVLCMPPSILPCLLCVLCMSPSILPCLLCVLCMSRSKIISQAPPTKY